MVLSAKGKQISAKQKFIYQMRDILSNLDLILEKIMVIRLTENVKIVGRNNAIHHFDTCGLSIFLQIYFRYYLDILKSSLFLRPKTDIFPHLTEP